jgi:pimeloyl-ACP methyl ester carboxylesterase
MNQGTKSGVNRTPNNGRSLADGLFIPVHGVEQWITIRGADRDNPALLALSGPGAAFSPWARFFAPWETRFTLVQWDQPGAGATLERNGGGGPLSIERLVTDGIAVAEHACSRLGKRKIALLGFSGGTIVGLSIARRRPDLVSVYAGSGQIVDWARQDACSYALLLEQARRAGDTRAREELESIGPPPYADTATDAVKSKYAGAMTEAERAALAALGPDELAALQAVPIEEARTRAMAAYDALRPEIVTFDARRLGRDFDVPMCFLQGERDVFTVTSEVRAYADWITAPHKRFVPIEGAGHSAFLMRDELLRLLDEHVRPWAVAGEAR